MADWRQIQARIRKAKSSSDPPAQLAELYERTRDAMVAFELATWQEKAGNHAEAARWYTSAAQRFRRALWRTKAEEALTRLGAPIPVAMTAAESAAENKPRNRSTQSRQRFFCFCAPLRAAKALRCGGIPASGLGVIPSFLLPRRQLERDHRVTSALVQFRQLRRRITAGFSFANSCLDLSPISHARAL